MEFNISHLVMTITAHDNNFWAILSSIGGIVSAICAIFMALLTYKTIEASKAQTKEIKRQYEEECRAYITVLPTIEADLLFLSIQNIGKLIAEEVNIEIDNDFINQLNKNEAHYEHLKLLNKSNFRLGVQQKYITAPFNGYDIELLQNKKIVFNLRYKDYKNLHHEKIEIDLSNYLWIVTSTKKSENKK